MCNTNNCCYVYAMMARHGACGSGIGQLGSPIPWRRVISSTVPLPIYHDIFLKDGQIAHKFHDSIAWWRYSNTVITRFSEVLNLHYIVNLDEKGLKIFTIS